MTVSRLKLYEITKMLVPLTVLIVVTAPVIADEADPTMPSLSISQFLESGNALSSSDMTTADTVVKAPTAHRLRLKGIVFRDMDNATALISLGDSRTYVVSLRRSELQSSVSRLHIGDLHLKVVDFSDSCVFLMNLDTNQPLQIR